ncbi:MAG: hypothetical protein LPK80_10835 [Bacteroidota bacterium]|nr:hypothetical protein [Bacteroidota bacterium]MDX5403910.1 hypothetical protein [Bacteroidota bacterium]MDX5429186.1 hypothetical protein [Bacteroidota bacterium]MDX5448037.1 hypothetical protein [Bacteroidota bacterium]MDX5506820.1 hypothetical protein [Bacteroidota bacterium]
MTRHGKKLKKRLEKRIMQVQNARKEIRIRLEDDIKRLMPVQPPPIPEEVILF